MDISDLQTPSSPAIHLRLTPSARRRLRKAAPTDLWFMLWVFATQQVLGRLFTVVNTLPYRSIDFKSRLFSNVLHEPFEQIGGPVSSLDPSDAVFVL